MRCTPAPYFSQYTFSIPPELNMVRVLRTNRRLVSEDAREPTPQPRHTPDRSGPTVSPLRLGEQSSNWFERSVLTGKHYPFHRAPGQAVPARPRRKCDTSNWPQAQESIPMARLTANQVALISYCIDAHTASQSSHHIRTKKMAQRAPRAVSLRFQDPHPSFPIEHPSLFYNESQEWT